MLKQIPNIRDLFYEINFIIIPYCLATLKFKTLSFNA